MLHVSTGYPMLDRATSGRSICRLWASTALLCHRDSAVFEDTAFGYLGMLFFTSIAL